MSMTNCVPIASSIVDVRTGNGEQLVSGTQGNRDHIAEMSSRTDSF